MELVVNLAPTGMIPTKDLNPRVPITPKEIIQDVIRCHSIGITSVHLHAREEDGSPTYKKKIYAEIISGIRETVPDVVICVSCSGRTFPEFEKRSDVLDLDGGVKPDMASLMLGSVNFSQGTAVNSPETIVRLAEKMRERGIKPELEIFDLGMVNFCHYMIRKKYLTAPYYFNIILGNIASAQAEIHHLAALLYDLPHDSIWSVGGMGTSQLKANTLSVALGGGVRVGIEDNLWYDANKTVPARNEIVLERIVRIIELSGHSVMRPQRLRERLKIDKPPR
jgi:3-keto-5-aminohexanoate cleavage enzyme